MRTEEATTRYLGIGWQQTVQVVPGTFVPGTRSSKASEKQQNRPGNGTSCLPRRKATTIQGRKKWITLTQPDTANHRRRRQNSYGSEHNAAPIVRRKPCRSARFRPQGRRSISATNPREAKKNFPWLVKKATAATKTPNLSGHSHYHDDDHNHHHQKKKWPGVGVGKSGVGAFCCRSRRSTVWADLNTSSLSTDSGLIQSDPTQSNPIKSIPIPEPDPFLPSRAHRERPARRAGGQPASQPTDTALAARPPANQAPPTKKTAQEKAAHDKTPTDRPTTDGRKDDRRLSQDPEIAKKRPAHPPTHPSHQNTNPPCTYRAFQVPRLFRSEPPPPSPTPVLQTTLFRLPSPSPSARAPFTTTGDDATPNPQPFLPAALPTAS